MKTYIARLLFSIDDGQSRSEFDEQVRIVSSSSLETALYKARALGRREEESFPDVADRVVHWKFIDVRDLYELDDLSDGAQIYSESHRVSDPEGFISYIRNKSMAIQAKTLTFA